MRRFRVAIDCGDRATDAKVTMQFKGCVSTIKELQGPNPFLTPLVSPVIDPFLSPALLEAVAKHGVLRATNTFDFVSPFDKSGVLYHIGTAGGTRNWVNPHCTGDVTVSVSGEAPKHFFVCPDNTQNITEHNQRSKWISVDLGEGRLLVPNHYCLRGEACCHRDYLRNWELQGSVDGVSWKTLKSHINDRSMNSDLAEAHWPIECDDAGFRHFRVYSNQNRRVFCCGIELYGALTA